MRRRLTKHLWPAALAAALTALFLGHLARPDALLATRDIPIFHLPLRSALGELVFQGLPVWNPTLHGGQPVLSNPNYAAFYPPTWLVLVAPAHLAIGIVILLHALLGFAGAYRLASHLECSRGPALLAGVGFAFGGAQLATTTLLNHYCGLAWLPWVALGGLRLLDSSADDLRRRLLLPAAALALQVLAGEPVMVLTSGLALLVLALTGPKRGARIRRLALVAAMALLLSAIQVVPTLLRLPQSPRSTGLAEERALAWSTSPARTLELVWPHAWGDPMRIDEGLFFGASVNDREFPFLFSLYPGQVILLLAAAALLQWPIRHRWAWLTLIVCGWFIASGAHNPIVALLVHSLPPLAAIRYPEKFLLLSSFALVLAAALGWHHLLASRERPGTPLEDFPIALAAILAGLNGLLFGVLAWRPDVATWFARTRSSLPASPELQERAVGFFRTEIAFSFAVSCLAIVVFILHRRRRTRRAILVAATLALLVGDLFRANHLLTPTVPASQLLTPPPALAKLDPEIGRLFTDRSLVGPSAMTLKSARPGPDQLWSQVERADPYLATLWGFEYAVHLDFDLMATSPARRSLDELRRVAGDGHHLRRLLGAWGVRYLGFNRPIVEILEARRAGEPTEQLRLEINSEYRPEVRFEDRVVFHPDLDAAVAAGKSSGFPGIHWSVPRGEAGSHAPTPTRGDCRLVGVEKRASRMTVRYESSSSAPLTIARTYDPGWRASVDDQRVEIFETDLGMMGLLLPAGERTVELRFRQSGLGSGLLLSLVGLGLLILGARTRGQGSLRGDE